MGTDLSCDFIEKLTPEMMEEDLDSIVGPEEVDEHKGRVHFFHFTKIL